MTYEGEIMRFLVMALWVLRYVISAGVGLVFKIVVLLFAVLMVIRLTQAMITGA